MAITRVQSTGKAHLDGTAGLLAVSFPAPPTAGNLIVVYGVSYDEAAEHTAGNFTDNKGNTYSLAIAGISTGGARPSIAYLQNVPASTGTFTVTFDPATGTYINLCAVEYSGVVTTGALDLTARNANAGTSPTVATGVISQADELIVACACNTAGGNPATFNPDAAFTEEWSEVNGQLYVVSAGAYRVVSSVASYTSTWTTDNENWSTVIATFKAAAGGGGGGGITYSRLERGTRGLCRGLTIGGVG